MTPGQHYFVAGLALGVALESFAIAMWIIGVEWGFFHRATAARRDTPRAGARRAADGKDASGKVAT